MKKIKQISQLRSEQKRLRHHQEDMEEVIKKDWKEIKETLRPKNIGKEFFLSLFINRGMQNKISSSDILTGSLSYGAVVLTKKLVEKVKRKVSDLFGK